MKIPFVKIFYFFRQEIELILEVSDCKFTYVQQLPLPTHISKIRSRLLNKMTGKSGGSSEFDKYISSL